MPKQLQFKTFVALGQTRYRCPFCEFDHYTPVEVLKHVHDSHPEDIGTGGPTLYDGDDKPIPKVVYATTEI